MSATTIEDRLAELSADTQAALYVWDAQPPPTAGSLRRLIPAARAALKAGATKAEMQMVNGRWLFGDDIRELSVRLSGGASAFTVLFEEGRVYLSSTAFRIEGGDGLTLLWAGQASTSDLPLFEAGAAEMVRRDQERCISGQFCRS